MKKPVAPAVDPVENIRPVERTTPTPDLPADRLRGPVDVVDFLGMTFPETPDVVSRVVVRPGVTIIRGDPFDAGALALNLAVARAAEARWLRWATWPGRTLYVDAVNQDRQVLWRVRRMRRSLPRPLPRGALTIEVDRSLKVDTPEGRARLEALLDASGADLVVFDTAIHLRAVSMTAVVAELDRLVQTRGLAIVITHDLVSGLNRAEAHVLCDGADRILRIERNGAAGAFDLELRQARKAAAFDRLPLTYDRETLWFQSFAAPSTAAPAGAASSEPPPAPARARA